VNTIKAVHDYADILRASIASAGNDHRLGANEAPPAIISIFIGKYLTDVLNEVEKRVGDKFDEQDEAMLKLDIHKSIPELMLDNTDRNRTSPFAFTGNKFEFRAVGSSENCAGPMTVLNTIMSETLTQFKTDVDSLIEKGEKKEIALMQIIQKYIVESKKILFEGDGYSDAWEKEAEKRGLPNVKTTPLALDAFVTKSSAKIFERHNIYSKKELEARHEILLENYTKKIQIEARIIGDMSSTYILPAAIKYQNVLIKNIIGLKELGFDENHYAAQRLIAQKISEHVNVINTSVKAMIEARKVANEISNTREKAIYYCDNVKKYFDEIRYHADKLELLVDDEYWQLPKYRELLFLR
jgi:glutamine synthetase